MNNDRNVTKRKILTMIRKIIGNKNLNYLLSYKYLGYRPNLNNPKTFNEKIQWIKFNANLEEVGPFVDKYAVKDYISKAIGADYLIPLIRVFKKENDINFDYLPNEFIMKASHTSGYNYIIKNLENEDVEKLEKLAKSWLKINYYRETGERNYKNIKPSILIEEIIGNGEVLTDYKIHSFKGSPKIIQVNGIEDGISRSNYYTPEWEKLPICREASNFERELEKPRKLDEIIEVAKTLSKPFNYVRVDLYYVDEKVYFGELSFTSNAGLSKFSDKQHDLKLGSYLELNKDILIKKKDV